MSGSGGTGGHRGSGEALRTAAAVGLFAGALVGLLGALVLLDRYGPLIGLAVAPRTAAILALAWTGLHALLGLVAGAALALTALGLRWTRRLLGAVLPRRSPHPLLLAAGATAAAIAVGWPVAAWLASRPSPPAAGAAAGAVTGSPARRLVLVSVDTLRADHLGAYGYPRDTTPRLDAVAAAGVLFEQAVSAAPNTHPSMASILTGLPVERFGLAASSAARPDALVGYLAEGHRTLAETLGERGFATAAVVSNAWVQAKAGFAQGFDDFDDRSCLGGRAACVTDRALALLDRYVLDRQPAPLFLWLHYLDPHHPYDPPPPYDGLFVDPAAELRPEVAGLRLLDVPVQTRFFRAVGRGRLRLRPAELAHLGALYDGEIRYVDAEIGRLLDGLAERALGDETLVVIVADHGEELLDHGGTLHAHTLYDELLRVPLLLGGPGLPAGVRVETPVSLLDLAPTLVDLLGFPGALGQTAGRSLRSEIHGSAAGNAVVRPAPSRLGPFLASLRGDGWKLISPGRLPPPVPDRLELADLARAWRRILAPPAEELYDLRSDPGEARNLLPRDLGFELPAAKEEDGVASEEVREQLRALGYLD